MPEHKEYRKLWIEAEYDKRMGSAWVRPPPEPHLIALYHFTTAEHAISNIALSRLKVARFSEANDPFELMALNFGVRGIRWPVRNFKKTQDAEMGMLCFSANWTKVTLWSHYAAKHRGVCLGFDVLQEKVRSVKYEDGRILEKLGASGDDPTEIGPELQERLLYTKAREWDYEQEHRTIVNLDEMTKEGSLYFCPFDAHMKLSEVILGDGCALSLESVRELTRTHHPDAVVIKARLAFGSFTVVPLESTIP